MKKSTAFLLSTATMLMGGQAAFATVLVQDDFESYADTAAMQAQWGSDGAGTLDATSGYEGSQAMAHPGGTDNIITFDDFSPTATESLHARGKIYDDGTANKRFSIGLRTDNPFPLFEMGMYNEIADTQYYSRVSTFPGQDPGWTALGEGTNDPVVGWHTFDVLMTRDTVTVTMDQNSDGTIDLSDTFLLSGDDYAAGINQIRLGGPSNLSSAGGGGFFDDILVETVAVPEPASLGLMGLGGLAMIARRRRA